MTDLHFFASIAAGILGLMMTTVSWHFLKGNPVLDNPVIHIAVGVLTFIGLRYRLGGVIGAILISYEAVAICILFLLLWIAFQKVYNAQKNKRQETDHKQLSQMREGPRDLQKTRTKTSRREISRRKD